MLAPAGPCKDIPDRGGFACCRDESCVTQTPGPPRKYFFEYNITFRHVVASVSLSDLVLMTLVVTSVML